MRFLTESDKLKTVTRSNVLLDLSRHENSAEHSWHAALFALVLADHAPMGCDLDRAIQMLLLHDLVEIDAGDHPVDTEFDAAEVARKEQQAADRLFGLLPADQGLPLRALWEEFEAGQTPSAIYAKRIDHVQPILQVFLAPKWQPDHPRIARHTLYEGRAKRLATDWPEIFEVCDALSNNQPLPDTDLGAQLRFLAEADQLKTVLRASPLTDNSRFENSAEHSWHVALWALILQDYASTPCDITTVIKMLLLHDLVEIDAGDNPVFGDHIPAEQDAQEQAAADRIFGLLPDHQAKELRALWDTFEAHNSPAANFGKALDRAAPPVQNLASGGGSWIAYNVTWDKFETRVAGKIAKGAPAVWEWLAPRVKQRLRELSEERETAT
jgi:putative hydrolase of HD superfamily